MLVAHRLYLHCVLKPEPINYFTCYKFVINAKLWIYYINLRNTCLPASI